MYKHTATKNVENVNKRDLSRNRDVDRHEATYHGVNTCMSNTQRDTLTTHSSLLVIKRGDIIHLVGEKGIEG